MIQIVQLKLPPPYTVCTLEFHPWRKHTWYTVFYKTFPMLFTTSTEELKIWVKKSTLFSRFHHFLISFLQGPSYMSTENHTNFLGTTSQQSKYCCLHMTVDKTCNLRLRWFFFFQWTLQQRLWDIKRDQALHMLITMSQSLSIRWRLMKE